MNAQQQKKRRRPGRVTLPAGQRKDAIVNFLVEPDLRDSFTRASRVLGLSVSAAGRDALLLWLKTVEDELDEAEGRA